MRLSSPSVRPGNGNVDGPVTLHLPASDTSTLGVLLPIIPRTWGSVHGNGHGSLVLNAAVPQGAYAFDHFQAWSGGSLGPLITAFGIPIAWSPDGTQLVLERSHDTVIHPTGIVLADAGTQDADLYVLRLPRVAALLPRFRRAGRRQLAGLLQS